MQCSNQCSCLFTRIMDYLHVLCMILMVWICVLCMTLMMFIYVYYVLFACTNLVDIIPLFFTIFFLMTDFCQNSSGNHVDDFQKKKLFDFSLKSADNSAKSAEIRDSEIQLFLRRL
jgi:hypothetical protein